MAALVAKFPKDDEAQTLYALSLLAIMPRGDQSLPLRQKAGAIVEGVLVRNPRHPGAAHYLLHAYDHGALASKALPAARTYAGIAPAASHALHMPAHTFIQLGHWEEAAATDRLSWDVSVQWAARRGASVVMRDFHSLTWLHYAWTQLGRFKEAQGALSLVEEALKSVKPSDTVGGHHYSDSTIGRGIGPEALRNDRGSMRARYVIESARWSEMKGQASFDGIDELFALGFSAAKLGDRAGWRRPSKNCGTPRRRGSRPNSASRPRSCCTRCRRSISSPKDATPMRSSRWTAPPNCRRACRSRSAAPSP